MEREALTFERRRLRRLRQVLVALAVVVAAAVLAVILAVRQTDRANREASTALSRALAQDALATMKSEPDLAWLLGLEAYRRGRTAEARDALVTGIEQGAGMTAPLRPDNKSVTSLLYSPDAKALVSADERGTIRVWDVRRQRQVGKALGVSSKAVAGLAFSPDGKILATGGLDGTTRFVLTDGLRPTGKALRAGPMLIGGVVFSPDGRTLAAGERSGPLVHGGLTGKVRLWDVRGGRQLWTPIPVGRDVVLSVRFSDGVSVAITANGKMLAMRADDGAIQLWDIVRRRPLGTPPQAGDEPSNVAFSPDGHTVAAGNADGALRLWDVDRRRLLGKPIVAAHRVQAVAFSLDGKILATGGGSGDVQLWDVSQRRPLGKPLDAGNATSRAWRLAPTAPRWRPPAWITPVRLWNVHGRRQLGAPLATGGDFGPYGVASSPDGKTLAAGGEGALTIWRDPVLWTRDVQRFDDGYARSFDRTSRARNGRCICPVSRIAGPAMAHELARMARRDRTAHPAARPLVG
ncbi:MAG: hypothetical protein V7607_2533 [Solirubrobacteraceae bacterium]